MDTINISWALNYWVELSWVELSEIKTRKRGDSAAGCWRRVLISLPEVEPLSKLPYLKHLQWASSFAATTRGLNSNGITFIWGSAQCLAKNNSPTRMKSTPPALLDPLTTAGTEAGVERGAVTMIMSGGLESYESFSIICLRSVHFFSAPQPPPLLCHHYLSPGLWHSTGFLLPFCKVLKMVLCT